MATVASAGLPDALKKALLGAVAAFAAFFVYRYVLRYFTWSEAAYGYYWAFRLPLIAHVTGGMIAALAGVWQIWTGLNAQSMRVHPWTGRLYAAGVLLGSLAAFVLAFTSAAYGFAWGVALVCLAVAWLATTGMALYSIRARNVLLHKQWMIRSYIVTFAFVLAFTSAVYGFAWAVALVCLAVAWLGTTGMALYSIRKRNVLLHKQWMIRSYIITFAFVTFRIFTDYVPYAAWGISPQDMANAAIWPVWVMPLLAYEMMLGRKRA